MLMGLFDFWKKEEKTVPAVGTATDITRGGLHKAYIPKFLYKPPFGYPRYVDLVTVRRLAAMPYVEMCISTIIDEICAIPWDILPIEGKEGTETEAHQAQVLEFFKNPNTNRESFEEIRRKYIRDILEVDAGVLNKVFNVGGEMVEIVARDGATFTKNPDIYGMMTDREDLMIESDILAPSKEISAMAIEPGFITSADAREKAAYFQYGWISGARPVPFGRREIIWLERNPRTDSIYGRSPVQILADTIQTLIYSIEHNLEYFNDNSIPKGVLGLEGSTADDIEAFKEQWVEQQREMDSAGNYKKKFHQMPIVGKTPTFTRFQLTNSELELLEGQKWWAKLVWACFGVTSVELGYTEDSKGLANQIVQSNVFKKRSINPLLRLEEFHLNQEIITEFGFDDVEFKTLQFDVDEEMKKAQLYDAQIKAGYKSVNEIRVEEGMEEVEWGDKQSPEEALEMQSKYQQPSSMEQEESNEKKKTKEKKEDMQPKKPDKKAMENNPLILRPNEVPGEDHLEKSIVYVLEQNKAKVKSLIEREMGENKLKEIKAVDDIAKSIEGLLTFEGLKAISDQVIKNTFAQGWDSAEKQLQRNLIVKPEVLGFIQDYTFNNIKGMTKEITDDLRQELSRGIMEGEGIAKIKARVEKVFDVGEVRAKAIAVTETARSEANGKLLAFRASGEKLKKRIIAAHDKRTSALCKRLDGQTVDINENFKDPKTGEEWQTNPFHVNCRSSVLYIGDEE